MNKKGSIKVVHLFIVGKVQQVGYRYWFKHEGEDNKLKGWVRNTNNNRVEAEITGDKKSINFMIKRCWKGPIIAKVENIIVKNINKVSLIEENLKGIKILETT
ncbi:MAG: Acylphosphatase [Alphaproteobacteria bacterium MarineAlpha6_Bin4]|nr:MAG: Acylphosphatase [Alphaproteobacteria bacterium MarineAlpha6_Bin3]PPR38323.1 MAG: Acylphosphatase [Alphaproteobacteria bacterium MarineAlpha6_Bin4]|tara:strand:+ start:30541 stop:30849 length:309 start_codon:yes stop_codon:yes gene_type:complete